MAGTWYENEIIWRNICLEHDRYCLMFIQNRDISRHWKVSPNHKDISNFVSGRYLIWKRDISKYLKISLNHLDMMNLVDSWYEIDVSRYWKVSLNYKDMSNSSLVGTWFANEIEISQDVWRYIWSIYISRTLPILNMKCISQISVEDIFKLFAMWYFESERYLIEIDTSLHI